MVRRISRSVSPVVLAAAASPARIASSRASAARQAAQNRPSLRLWLSGRRLATQQTRRLRSPPAGVAGLVAAVGSGSSSSVTVAQSRPPDPGRCCWARYRVLQVLHNPRYAGAFAYGRRHQRRGPDGRTRHTLQPRESWTALIPGAHPGYISWDTYEDNLRRLAESAQSRGTDRRASPPREGPALLQGLAICGRCGNRMTVRYHTRRGVTFPEYLCQRAGIEDGGPPCARITGDAVDAAIGELLLATVTPVALDVAISVQAELEARAADADGLRRQHVERARYAADQARRRYLAVDPGNRLVAANLEADWNEALRHLNRTREDYERHSAAAPLGDTDRARIVALATDFPALWSDPRTPQRERKRMIRLLIDDVTLTRQDRITAAVRLRGGQTAILQVPIRLPAPEARRTPAQVIARIDQLLDGHTEAGVAEHLDQAGILSGTGQAFHAGIVRHRRVKHQLASREQRLLARGLLGLEAAAAQLGVCTQTVKRWHHEGLIGGELVNDKGTHLYRVPERPPRKRTGRPPKGAARPARAPVPD